MATENALCVNRQMVRKVLGNQSKNDVKKIAIALA
jgi:hypothetical protein